MICWFCQQEIAVNADTCWPVEASGGTQNAPTHSACMRGIMNRIDPPWDGRGQAPVGTPVRGPGGNNIVGYTRGAAPQY
jgi:hypothetical protein